MRVPRSVSSLIVSPAFPRWAAGRRSTARSNRRHRHSPEAPLRGRGRVPDPASARCAPGSGERESTALRHRLSLRRYLRHRGERESPDGDSCIERRRYARPPARQRHRSLLAAARQRPGPAIASLTQTSDTRVADSPARLACPLSPAARRPAPDRCSPEQPRAGRACQDGPAAPGALSTGADTHYPGAAPYLVSNHRKVLFLPAPGPHSITRARTGRPQPIPAERRADREDAMPSEDTTAGASPRPRTAPTRCTDACGTEARAHGSGPAISRSETPESRLVSACW